MKPTFIFQFFIKIFPLAFFLTCSAGVSSQNDTRLNKSSPQVETTTDVDLFNSIDGLSPCQSADSVYLDTTFAVDGEFLFTKYAETFAHAAVTAPDGSIFITGKMFNGANYDVLLLKLKSNGVIDTSFNQTGYIIRRNIAGGKGDDEGRSIDLLPDGNLLIGGLTRNTGNQKQGFLWKLSTSGIDNQNFGKSSIYFVPPDYIFGKNFHSQYDSFSKNIFIVSENHSTYGDLLGPIAFRVLANGSGLDTSFSGNGVLKVSSVGDLPVMNSDNNGNLMISAEGFVGGNGRDALSWIVNTRGTIVRKYGNLPEYNYARSHADLAGGAGIDYWGAIVPYEGNRMILAGYSENAKKNLDEIIARVNMADGSFDTSFGGGTGYWTEDVRGLNEIGRVRRVAVQTDGSIIGALEMEYSGKNCNPATNDFNVGIIRLTSDGKRDMTISSGKGILVLGGDYTDRQPSLSQQSDGRILVLGGKGTADGSSLAVWAIKIGGNINNDPPIIHSSFQSTDEINPSDTVLFIIRAYDPHCRPLIFDWSANGGQFGNPVNSQTDVYWESKILWQAPVTDVKQFIIKVAITNDYGNVTIKEFLPVSIINDNSFFYGSIDFISDREENSETYVMDGDE